MSSLFFRHCLHAARSADSSFKGYVCLYPLPVLKIKKKTIESRFIYLFISKRAECRLRSERSRRRHRHTFLLELCFWRSSVYLIHSNHLQFHICQKLSKREQEMVSVLFLSNGAATYDHSQPALQSQLVLHMALRASVGK